MDSTGNAERNFCYNCMAHLNSGEKICPVCGHDNSHRRNPENALPEGTILAGKYLVGKVLGQGGFGITYLGFDTALDIKVAVKEYFPVGVSIRSPHSIRVTAVSSEEKAGGFHKGCDEFQAEARRLAAIDSPNIVKVRDYFRENGTAYIVMNYVDGSSLTEEVSDCGGRMPWQRVVELFKPLIQELDKLHKAHLIHRDIKPDNIKVVKNEEGAERLLLLDFGAARSFISAEVTGTYSAVVSHGYAPIEQYSPKSRQGPYTDVYALCATMYAVLTGTLPADATDRMLGAAEIASFPELNIEISENVEKAIRHGLAVRSEDRPQSMKELYNELCGKSPVSGEPSAFVEKYAPEPHKEEKKEEIRKPAEETKSGKKMNWLLPVLMAVLLAAGFFLYRGIRQNQLNTAGTQTAEAEISARSALELAVQQTVDGQNTQIAQAGMTEQAAAAGTRTAQETQEALHVQQTGTAWNITAAAEYQQTRTQEAAEASATQAEQANRMKQTVQVETQWALNTAAAVRSEQTATSWFTTQEAQLHQTQTREAEEIQATAALFALQTVNAEQTQAAAEQQTATKAAVNQIQTQTAAAEQQTATQSAINKVQTQTAIAEQTASAQEQTRAAEVRQTSTQVAVNKMQTQTVIIERTAVAAQTAAALEQIRIELEQTEAAFHVMETEAAYEETRQAMEMRMTSAAAAKTKAAEPTSTPMPTMTATATATPRPTMTNTPEPTATATSMPTAANTPKPKPTLSPDALYDLGEDAYKDGDYEKALEYLIPAAEAGNADAQYRLGGMYYSGRGVAKSYEEAAKWYQEAADQGNADAQNNLGSMYENGRGVEQSYEEAVRWYQRAADQGYKYAQFNLGYLYYSGHGVEQSYKEAAKWFRQAADQEHTTAQYFLGVMYEYGQGVEKSYEEAIKWYQLAADQGYKEAQQTLGNIYYFGNGVEKSYEEAVKWYQLAADQGDKYAQTSLGSMYENGEGVAQSYEEAIKWYQLAADQGHENAQNKLKDLLNKHPELKTVIENTPSPASDAAQKPTDMPNSVCQVISDTLLRDKPTNSGTVLRSVLKGTILTYNGESQEAEGKTWIHVRTENGNEGWIEKAAAELQNNGHGSLKVGDILTLGHYEQDGNLNNGPEVIEWQALAVEDGRALVISRYGLDVKPYNETYKNVIWETCTLRAWLNGNFYNSAFSNTEKGQIQQVTVKNPNNAKYGTKGGNDTTELIFLLSIDEAEQYFATKEARQCKPTAYAKNSGAYVSENLTTSSWWLRSPGDRYKSAVYVSTDGKVNDSGSFVNNDSTSVRPAFWLNL